MARTSSTNLFAALQIKTLLLASVVVMASVTTIILSQPMVAIADIPSEVCSANSLSDTTLATNQTFSDSTASTIVNVSSTDKQGNELFWNSLTKAWLTAEQISLLHMAYQVGNDDAGSEHAELLQAVLLQETIAGQLGRIGHMTAPVGKRSYGVMQVKVSAARDVLRKHKEFGRFRSDEELIISLMTKDEFNIRVASKFLLKLTTRTKSFEKGLVAYNIGLRASRKISEPHQFKYVKRTKRNLSDVVRPFNQRFTNLAMQVAMK